MAVRHDRRRPVLDRPACRRKSPSQIDVAARADALRETADRVEGGAPNQQVAGRGGGGAHQALGRAQEMTRARVASHERPLRGIARDRA